MIKINPSEIVTIPFNITNDIKNAVVKKMGVESLFKLNDKLDGLFYLNTQMKRVLSCYVVQKIFNIILLDTEKILKCKTQFEFKNKKFQIIGVESSEKIKIKREDVDGFIIVKFFDKFKKAQIIGHIDFEKCLQMTDSINNSNSVVSKDIIAIVSKDDLTNFIYD